MQGSRVPRGHRAPQLYSRAPFSQNHYFCLDSKKKKTLGFWLHSKISGLQGYSFET